MTQGHAPSVDGLSRLNETLAAIQVEYMATIKKSLSLLVSGEEAESYALLADRRNDLEPARERLGRLITEERQGDHPWFRLVIEYLFTRARLVEELKMFPEFGMQLLDRLTLDQSLEETIYYLESAMTGKRNLYIDMHAAYEAMITGR